MNIEEFNIPMPWGYVAVKAWGNPSDKPVVAMHGRIDNAGSFDRLIPLLPKSFYYICIDLPSHGRSSHLPHFFPIHFFNFVIACKLVLDYFKRGKYILLGHSYGAGVQNLFSRLYPEYVEKVIGLDTFAPFIPAYAFKDYLTSHFDQTIRIHEKESTGTRPTYTEQEATEKIRTGRWGEPLTTEAAVTLAKRVLEPAANGRYFLSSDQRMKYPLSPLYDQKYLIKTARLYPITCPFLLILCRKSSSKLFLMDRILDEVGKWKKTKIHWVDAGHDVHLTEPEVVSKIISDFLLQTESKL